MQELTHKYQFDIIHRPDMSLRYYGYVAAQERPLLAAVDLPGADSDNQHSPTAPDDSAYDGELGRVWVLCSGALEGLGHFSNSVGRLGL